MNFVLEMLRQAVERILDFDPRLWATIGRTLWLAFASTVAAALVAVPLGGWIGMRSRGPVGGPRAVAANIGLGLPPVVLGIFLGLLLLPGAPLGWLNWLVTLRGVWLAQLLLAIPLIVALTAGAAAQGPAQLVVQARALGASPRAQLGLLIAELQPAILAALLAAALAGIGEVGAVIIVGGNVPGHTNTLASTVVLDLSAGDVAGAVAHAIMLGMLVAVLTWALGRAQRAAREVVA